MINSLSSKSVWVDTCLVSSDNSNSFPVVPDIQLRRKHSKLLTNAKIYELMRKRQNLEDDERHRLHTASMPNLSGVSSSTVSFSCTVMIKGCKKKRGVQFS